MKCECMILPSHPSFSLGKPARKRCNNKATHAVRGKTEQEIADGDMALCQGCLDEFKKQHPDYSFYLIEENDE